VIRTLVLILIFVASQSHAGFKMYGPNGYMESTETDSEKAAREDRDARNRKAIEDAEAYIASQPKIERKKGAAEPAPVIHPQSPKKEYDDNGKKPGREAKRNVRKTGFRNKQDFEKHYKKK